MLQQNAKAIGSATILMRLLHGCFLSCNPVGCNALLHDAGLVLIWYDVMLCGCQLSHADFWKPQC